MFAQYSVTESSARRGWSFAGSLVGQAVGTVVLVLLPLLNTYEIDLAAWSLTSFRLAVPPPPAPPPPSVRPSLRPVRQRYDSDFRSPVAIPDKVAVLHDLGTPVSPIAGMSGSLGIAGGTGTPGVAGVLGMFPADAGNLPLPPPIRVGGRIQQARLTHRVLPVYPEEAVNESVSGTVRLEAVIAVDGAVRDLTLVEGHPMLAPAAIEAVSQWIYRPTTLNGRKVEVVTLIEVNFNLTVMDEKELKRRARQDRRERNRR